MKGSQLLDKMELIHPAYIEAAEKRPMEKKNKWLGWGAIAACLCLSLALILLIGHYREPLSDLIANGHKTILNLTPESRGAEPQASDQARVNSAAPSGPTTGEAAAQLPSAALSTRKKITIPDLVSEGMGFEGYLYHDISELVNGNPWSESMTLETLPVYKNGAFDALRIGSPIGMSEEEMTARLNQTVSSLGLQLVSTELQQDGFVKKGGKTVQDTEHPTSIHAQTDQGSLDIQADGEIVFFPTNGKTALPDDLSFTYADTSDAEAAKTLAWLTETYADFLHFEKAKSISWGDFNMDNKFNRRYEIYDAAGDPVEQILNYHFRQVSFAPDDEGKLLVIRKKDALLKAEKIGDYPIISVEKARERLLAGHYQTSVPADFPGADKIAKVELMYRSGSGEEVFLPYYRFYVLLPSGTKGAPPEDSETGLKTYGAYYVPALRDDDVKNMPTYDGHFN